MIEVEFLGRAGQGILTSSNLLATAAFYEGKYTQSFPMFGAERGGAPVHSFLRIDDTPINLRSQIQTPDYTIIFDDSLLKAEKINAKKEIFINSDKKLNMKANVICCSKDNKYSNTALISYFIKKTKLISLPSLIKAIKERFDSETAKQNIEIAERFYKL